jgi:hypothetical protein
VAINFVKSDDIRILRDIEQARLPVWSRGALLLLRSHLLLVVVVLREVSRGRSHRALGFAVLLHSDR